MYGGAGAIYSVLCTPCFKHTWCRVTTDIHTEYNLASHTTRRTHCEDRLTATLANHVKKHWSAQTSGDRLRVKCVPVKMPSTVFSWL